MSQKKLGISRIDGRQILKGESGLCMGEIAVPPVKKPGDIGCLAGRLAC